MFSSLWRGLGRILILALIGTILVHASVPLGHTFGAVAAPVLFNIGLMFHAAAAGDALLRILLPRLDAQRIAEMSIGNQVAGPSIAAAIVFGFHTLLRIVVFVVLAGAAATISPNAQGATLPDAAKAYLPILKEQARTYAPELQPTSTFGAQIHRETGPCPGRQCWKVYAQLRTSREQGRSFGQFTRTWSKTGALRFDALTEIVRAHPRELAGLSWDNPDDPVLQLRALVLKDRDLYMRVEGAATNADRWAFTLAAYNGGEGSVRSDRLMCEATDGCDSSRWFGNVERTSMKSRQAVQGYGQSWFEINRSYVQTIWVQFRPLYATLDA